MLLLYFILAVAGIVVINITHDRVLFCGGSSLTSASCVAILQQSPEMSPVGYITLYFCIVITFLLATISVVQIFRGKK